MSEPNQKDIEKVRKLKGLLKNLEPLSSKGEIPWHQHSDVSKGIGNLVGNPTANNNSAFNDTSNYIREIESSHYDSKNKEFISDLKEAQKYIQMIRSNRSPSKYNFSLMFFGLSFLLSLFFLSPNLTGNAVGISKLNSNLLGIFLFTLGILGMFFSRK